MITTEPNQRHARKPASVSSAAGAGSRYVSWRASSSICCAKSARATGLSPAIWAKPMEVRRPPSAPASAVAMRPVRCERSARRRMVTSPRSLVEAQEDLLERRLSAFELRYARARESREQSLELTAEHPADAMILHRNLLEPWDPADTFHRRRVR